MSPLIVQLLMLVLSVCSLASVRALLNFPDRAVDRPVPVPQVLYPALDEGYFDTRGLV